jgi:pyruvate/2-oxoglutarate dehydrogenase complex dihydrolipoamide dehydrogenase (E3) component
LRDAEQFDEYGLIGSIPDLDFQSVFSHPTCGIKMHEKKQFLHHLRSSDVTVFAETGSVHFVDPHTIALADGQQLQAEKFILCAGGRSRRLDFPGAEHALTHQDLWSLKHLPRSIVIAGAAATGCRSIFQTSDQR